ncbi:MAG: exonuclease SbcCD subunit D C-terminal domain-containing protein [Acidimicrobiia bacterium]|nr:exonuclease SbcCD subunit D C-terminal domain-containing protein [Acidimicrobiia bacterium]
MRVLHTSDWHVGKRLGRYERIEETRTAIEEVAGIADSEGVDLVVHSGDLFDRPVPPMEALQVGLAGLVRLTNGGARPVVVVAGNHDSSDLFEALAPFLAGWGIHLVGAIKAPAEGGVLRLATAGGEAVVACLPFLREGRVVDFMADTDRWYGQYAERVRRLTEAYSEYVVAEADTTAVSLLVAHFMVTGARVGGHGAPRGERELHMGEAYAVGEGAIPPSLGYVAMGHIHAPQPVPGANVPAEYAGSLLELDFGEAGEEKRVVVVDVEPGTRATVRSVPLTGGRPLRQVTGTWEEICGRTDIAGHYLDLKVATDGPEPGLDALARDLFPYLVKVAAVYDREAVDEVSYSHLPWEDVYAAYYEHERGEPAPDALLRAFREVEDEVSHAAP